MKNSEEFDNFENFERKDTAGKLPLGWLILFFGLIVFGIIYIFLYTPNFSGWSQEEELKQELKMEKK
jgi:hypothetical protein